MKKILLLTAVACMAMTSCKKDYTCECTGAGLPAGYGSAKYTKVKKKDAQKSCDDINTTYQVYGADISCTLK